MAGKPSTSMQRHYFISDSLDELESLEAQLEAAGVSTPQIHVLSGDDADVERHHLHAVRSFMKQDVVHTTLRGALAGLTAFATVLVVAYLFEWTRSAVGWPPFLLLATVLLGFCTWIGGLIGIQLPNHHFRRFAQVLREGKHVLFVDLDPPQEGLLRELLATHPQLQQAGTGAAVPRWVVAIQQRFGTLRRAHKSS